MSLLISMKNNFDYFLRQTIKMSPKAKPSNDPNKIRLTFLEKPYRKYKRLTQSNKSVIIALFMTVTIPFLIFQGMIPL